MDENGKPTNDTGIIVGTNLHNRAMPMIRYRQNDLERSAKSNVPAAGNSAA